MKRPDLAIIVTASALVLTAGLAACGGGGGGEETIAGAGGKNLVIGDSVPLTGSLAILGPSGQKAAGLALAQIDKAIAATGTRQTVTLETADSATTPQGAVRAVQELAAKGASCIAGAWSSVETIATARSVSIPKGILQISPPRPRTRSQRSRTTGS